MAPDQALIAKVGAPEGQQPMIVLHPIAPPGLGDIRIDENLFAVGRAEAPFDSYPPEVVADLSRRHARIFGENGAVYLADLDSKNGTTVNGTAVRHTIVRLSDGDELGFGRALSYRVRLADGLPTAGRTGALASLTLTPAHGDLGLQPIVITQFPFLISKTDEAFARYRHSYPHQVNYLSRKHAHIFLKAGRPFIEDLGSTNGSFVDSVRLDEHAVALSDGDLLAFGGRHFVYRVSVQWKTAAFEPTVTRLGVTAPPPAAAPAIDTDKTTFVGAAASFLDIFCVDQAGFHADERNDADEPPAGAPRGQDAAPVRPRGKAAAFMAELAAALGGGEARKKPLLRWASAALALAGILGWVLYQAGAPERDTQDLLASGKYAEAARVAGEGLARDPDNARLTTLATEALLKANVPAWAGALKAQQYERAARIVGAMRQASGANPNLRPLLDELAWIGELEQFVHARGGADAPVRDDADATRIKRFLQQWDDDTQQHQRAFSTISSYAPEFGDVYAQALSHVRKLALSGAPAEHEQTVP